MAGAGRCRPRHCRSRKPLKPDPHRWPTDLEPTTNEGTIDNGGGGMGYGELQKGIQPCGFAWKLDPYFGGVLRYCTALHVHYVAQVKKDKFGCIDLYALLGFKAKVNNYPSLT